MLTGIAGVWLGIKEKILAWPLFIICYASYVYISCDFGLFAFMGMNIVFIGISGYGWSQWARQSPSNAKLSGISKTSSAHWPLVGLALLAGTLGIGWLLASRGEAQLPYLDAFATCSGFIAQWMLSRKQIETWLFWILSDIVYIGLFAAAASWPSVLLFGIFTILAVKGWRDWKQQLT
jgi:nicotinamide mononucleotide transporter